MTNGALRISLAFGLGLTAASSAFAACTVPNSISNGQVADASKVMGNFTAVANCADAKSPAGSTNGVQINGGSGVLGSVAPLTSGQVLMGVTGGPPVAGTINAGAGISISNTANSITISSAGGGGGGSDIVMALGAAWAKEMVLNGGAITAGVTRSVKADLGAYVGLRIVANTNTGYSNRAVSSVTYTVPTGAVAFVVHAKVSDAESTNQGYYGVRLYNVTKNTVAAGTSGDSLRNVPSASPGTAAWHIQSSGTLSTDVGGGSSDVNAYYPVAGVAGDVLQLEAWTSGDGNYRMQDMAVYLVIVNATTGAPIS